MSRQNHLLVPLSWLGVVAFVAGATWVAISSVGLSDPPLSVPPIVPTPAPDAPTGAPGDAPSATPGTTPTPAQPTSAIWTDDAGSVAAECDGQTIALRGATPADGYSAHKREAGDAGRIEVEFEPQSDGRKVEVRVSCRAGSPRFEIENSGAGD